MQHPGKLLREIEENTVFGTIYINVSWGLQVLLLLVCDLRGGDPLKPIMMNRRFVLVTGCCIQSLYFGEPQVRVSDRLLFRGQAAVQRTGLTHAGLGSADSIAVDLQHR